MGRRTPVLDLEATDALVRQSVGEVPASVRLVLESLADGVKLTPGGRLPRSVVRPVREHRPHWYPLDRPVRVEEDLYPLAVLHDRPRQTGPLRLANGGPRPTRAAADDLDTIRRRRSWFEQRAATGTRPRRGRWPDRAGGSVRPDAAVPRHRPRGAVVASPAGMSR